MFNIDPGLITKTLFILKPLVDAIYCRQKDQTLIDVLMMSTVQCQCLLLVYSPIIVFIIQGIFFNNTPPIKYFSN